MTLEIVLALANLIVSVIHLIFLMMINAGFKII